MTVLLQRPLAVVEKSCQKERYVWVQSSSGPCDFGVDWLSTNWVGGWRMRLVPCLLWSVVFTLDRDNEISALDYLLGSE